MKVALHLFLLLSFIGISLSIDGGISAFQSSARFVTSVRLRGRDSAIGNGFLCAAAMINNLNVVTAASCVQGRQASELIVAMGHASLSRRDFYSRVQRITIHQNFSTLNPLNYNIAVLRLSRVTTSSGNRNQAQYVQSISMDTSIPTSPQSCQLYAWGTGSFLMQANLPVWQQSSCQNSTDGLFCAGNLNNGPSVCRRNLGGVYVCDFRFSGIVIEDSGCRQVGRAGHFHSVSYFRDFILTASKSSRIEVSLILGFFVAVVKIFLWRT